VVVLFVLLGCTPRAAVEPTVAATPKRIVSLVPSVTELIHSVGASDRIVGVTLNDDYPESVKLLPKIGDQTIDMEKVVSLEPDLVILDSSFNQDTKALENLGLKTLELRCERLDDIPLALETLGSALGLPDRGQAEAQAFRDGLAQIQPLSLDKTVFVEVWGTPLMTVGSDTLVNDLLVVSGLKNCYADQKGYFQVDPEDVLSRSPGVVIIPLTSQTTPTKSQASVLLQRAGQEPKIVEIDPDLFMRPGPRLLQGIKTISDQLQEAN
jgi:iron complex transport system substrate-binding protein